MQRIGGAMIGRATETIRKWTETARAAPVPGLPMVLDMLEWAYGRAIQGMPGLDGAEELAASYAARYATTDEAVAPLRGHDLQSAEVRTLALACMTGSKAADTLKDAGVRLGTKLTRDALGWLSPVLIKKVERSEEHTSE